MPDKCNQTKCVQELMSRTAIQQQFPAGWRPVGGSELASEWIQLDKEYNVRSDEATTKKVKKIPKSFMCKFSHAKLKVIARRRAKARCAQSMAVGRRK